MAGTSRFHDKLHRCNHHTLSTAGVPDSGYDPIASPSSPFRGDFVTTHNLSTAQGVISDTLNTANSAVINGNLLVDGDVTQLNTVVNVTSSMYVYGPLQMRNTDALINDGINTVTYGPYTLALNFGLGVYINPRLTVDSSITTNTYYGTNVIANSGLFTDTTTLCTATTNNSIVMGRLGVGVASPQKSVHVVGDVLIYGNLSATGDSSFRNTLFTTTSSLSIVNTGTGAGLTVTQEGDQPIVAFFDHESTISLWADGNIDRPGWVGIKTSHPTTELTVAGSISASGSVYGTIPGFSNVQTSSSNWETTYSTVKSNSGNWSNGGTSYTILQTNSAAWNSGGSTSSTVQSNSAFWSSVYSTVNSNSGSWSGGNTAYLSVRSLSSSWTGGNTAYVAVNTLSSSWGGGGGTVYSLLTSSSASWNGGNTAYTNLTANSATWMGGRTAYTNLTANSGTWAGVYSLVFSHSATWESGGTGSAQATQAYGTVNVLSASWSSAYYITNSLSGSWNTGYTAYTNLTANSATWIGGNTAYLSVGSLSTTWTGGNTAYVAVNALSSSWSGGGTTYSLLTASSASWTLSYTTLTSQSASWNYNTSILLSNSALWSSVYSTVNSNSANWNNNLTVLQTNSARWINASNYVTSNSAVTTHTTLGVTGTTTTGNLALTSTSVQTFTTEVSASGDFLVLSINGINRKIRLWD